MAGSESNANVVVVTVGFKWLGGTFVEGGAVKISAWWRGFLVGGAKSDIERSDFAGGGFEGIKLDGPLIQRKKEAGGTEVVLDGVEDFLVGAIVTGALIWKAKKQQKNEFF